MSELIVKDTLPIGITVDGKQFKAFSMRPAVLRDFCAAIEEVGADAPENTLRYATMAQRVSFEGLEQKHVTCELLMGMYDRDAVALEMAAADIEKKLDALSNG